MFSAGLREGPTSGERLRAAAPGVLLRLDTEWSDADRERFAERHGLTAGTPLSRGQGWYSFDGPVGLDAMEKAAELLAAGEVLDASPNWWKPVQKK